MDDTDEDEPDEPEPDDNVVHVSVAMDEAIAKLAERILETTPCGSAN